MRLRVAFRNLLRNSQRTALNLLMIAGSMVAIILFRAYAEDSTTFLAQLYVEAEGGHLRVSRTLETQNELLRGHLKLKGEIERLLDVAQVNPRIEFYALLGLDEETTTARGIGLEQEERTDFFSEYRLGGSSGFSQDDSQPQVILSSGVARRIRAKVGSTIVILAESKGGILNGLEARVVEIIHTTLEEIDQNLFYIPLGRAQEILEVDSVHSLRVQLKNPSQAPLAKKQIQSFLQNDSKVMTWFEIYRYFGEVQEFFKGYNAILALILFSLVLFGISNTVGMSIYERTGEVGTLRALGETRFSIVSTFLLEGVLLGLAGSFIGSVLAWTLGEAFNYLRIPVSAPGGSTPFPLHFVLGVSMFFQAAITTIAITLVATLFPALRASRMVIVRALDVNL